MLRILATRGVGLSVVGHMLEVDAPAGALYPELVAALQFNRCALLVSVPPVALRRELDIPDTNWAGARCGAALVEHRTGPIHPGPKRRPT